MSNRVFSAILVSSLSIGMLALAFSIQSVEATPTPIIVPDDYPTIQDAINNANEGDTIFVRAGTYSENIVMKRAMSLVGESKETTIIDGKGTGDVIHIVGTYGTSITGFTIKNGWPCGISTYLSGTASVRDNIISDNSYGLRIEQSGSTNIVDNLIMHNTYGVSHWYSGASVMTDNFVTGNTYGIEITYSQRTTLKRNIMTENTYNFGVWSYGGPPPYGTIYDFVHDIDSSNTVDGRPIYYFVNRQLVHVPEDAGFLGIVNSTDVVVDDLCISNNGQGVLFAFVTKSIIENVTVFQNMNGIRLVHSNNNTINGNMISDNDHGVYLRKSHNNLIYHNNFVNNIVNQASIDESYDDFWDNGYPSGGNYWSDYAGVDAYHGPSQDIAGNDGIGDAPYIIDANNIDHYPLMNPWSAHQLTVTSSPIAGIPFTINAVSKTTPYAESLPEGYYTVEMPETYNGYNWSRWLEDGDTNRIKTIYLHGTTWTGVYVSAPQPSPTPQPSPAPVGGEWIPIDKLRLVAPWISLVSLMTAITLSFVYIRRRRKHRSIKPVSKVST